MDTPPTPIRPPPPSEKTSVIVASLVFLGLDVVMYGGIVVHTMLSRRRYGKLVDELELRSLSFMQEFFLETPGPLYAAGYLLLVVALMLKEVAIEHKGITLRLNVLALVGAAVLIGSFLWTVQWPFEKMLRE